MLRSSLRSSLGRVRDTTWPLARAAVAAGIAWFLTQTVLGHPQPFFASVAAVVALAKDVGGRGIQATEMLVGVALGVATSELLVLVPGMEALGVNLVAAGQCW
jgi:uncharacterized membrane protein YgaE (UPF0421/DUF939 family)